MVQLAPTPVNYLSAESIASYGAIITSFMGAIQWGANLHTLGKPATNDRWIDRNVWAWGVIPAIVSWIALHIYIPVGLFILAAVLAIQLKIDQNTYAYYFDHHETYLAFMKIRKRLTYTATGCLMWAALVILFIQA